EGISLDKAEEILNLKGYSNNKNSYLTLFTLDEDLGPFTREELRVLNSKLQVESLEVVDRLVLALCLEFGLRPIQIALIKESDFVEDLQLGICYLNIPRVKNNTKYRRLEFTKRIV
ncbi:TPA: site-specific integrase, partial [Vibrio parahaemolyticus]|nr:site-specific integrase [Vibrio parahaemolyticus]